MVARVPLPDVAGRIDHLALDSRRGRLFVAALENGTVEVIDLGANRHAQRIDDFREPQGILFLPDADKLLVTNGGDASMSILRGSDLTRIGRVDLRADPDNIRFEASAGHAWVGEGMNEEGALAAIDPNSGERVSTVPLHGHPESFQLEAAGPRAFVNVPAARALEVIDRRKRKVVAKWALPCAGNFPLALDEANERLFVGCRRPPSLVVLATATGVVTDSVDIPRDVDDIFVDRERKQIYVSAGEGFLRVFSLSLTGALANIGDVPTGPGARTSLFDPGAHRLYVAVPRSKGAAAEILIFATE